MPHFVTLIRYTQQGIAKIKESPVRLEAAKKTAEKVGGKIHAWYLTMGQYDAHGRRVSQHRRRAVLTSDLQISDDFF